MSDVVNVAPMLLENENEQLMDYEDMFGSMLQDEFFARHALIPMEELSSLTTAQFPISCPAAPGPQMGASTNPLDSLQGLELPTASRSFRFQGRRVHLTYPGHLDLLALKDLLEAAGPLKWYVLNCMIPLVLTLCYLNLIHLSK